MHPITGRVAVVTYSDVPYFGDGVRPQLVDHRQQHLVTGYLAEVDPGDTHPIISPTENTSRMRGSLLVPVHCDLSTCYVMIRLCRVRRVPEQEEEAAAHQLHLQTLLEVEVEEGQQLGDVGER